MAKSQAIKVADVRKSRENFNPDVHQERIKVGIDRVTILIDGSAYLLFMDLDKRFRKFLPAGFKISKTDFNSFSILKDFENEEDVNLVYVEAINKINSCLRIDFNPNSLKEYDGMVVWRQIMNYIKFNQLETHLSRLDLAFDVYNMPSISNLKHIKGGVSEKKYYGRSNELETHYFGSRSSNVQVRLYDKQKERLQRGKLIEDDLKKAPYHWRFEMQLRTKAIDKNTVDEVIARLSKFGIYDYQKLGADMRFAYLYLQDESILPQMYPELTLESLRKRKSRIRKRLEEQGSDFSEKMVNALIEQMPQLAEELKQYTQEFLGFE